MLRFARHLLLCAFLVNCASSSFPSKVVLSDGVTFFQGFDGYSCLWADYKDFEWETINSDQNPENCANACARNSRCTGFELSNTDSDPYCAFWYGGACGHEEMHRQHISFYLRHFSVATYVLMDGRARFHEKQCDYQALNISAGVNMAALTNVLDASESKCSSICNKSNNCTGSVAPVKAKKHSWCNLLSDHSCTIPDVRARNQVTTIRYPLSSEDPPSFTDTYSLCNPFSEVLRGYRTCAEYVAAFPCDCYQSLGDMCTNADNASLYTSLSYIESNGELISYNPKKALSTICPAECKHAARRAASKGHICGAFKGSGTIMVFLLVVTPMMFIVVLVMAIWTYVRRRCFFHRGPHAQPIVPAMKKKDIEQMETEEFTSESELKYGEIECSICLVAFEVGDIMRVMKCGHRFHKACVDEWLSRYKSVCPLCKADMRGKIKACPEVDAGAHAIEMGEMTAVDNDNGNLVDASESGHSHNPSDDKPPDAVDGSEAPNLSESLLENDGLASAGAAMYMQPVVEEETTEDDGVVDEMEDML